MDNDPASRFGFDTLTLDAVIVRDSEENAPSRQELAMGPGDDILTIPAVLVPLGGTPPAGDWLNLGVARLPPQPERTASRATRGAPDGTPSPVGQAPERQRPETRFYHPRGVTPAPNTEPDPISSAAEQRQRINVMDVAAKRGRAAGPGVARKPKPAPEPALPTVDTRTDQ